MQGDLSHYLLRGEGPKYAIAAETAAHMTNVIAFNYDGCKAELFGVLLFLILNAIYEADELMNRLEPSKN